MVSAPARRGGLSDVTRATAEPSESESESEEDSDRAPRLRRFLTDLRSTGLESESESEEGPSAAGGGSGGGGGGSGDCAYPPAACGVGSSF